MEQVLTPFEKFLQFLPYLIPFVVLHLVIMVIALVDLARREKTRGPKWVWVPVVIFISLFGSIIYFIFGRKE